MVGHDHVDAGGLRGGDLGHARGPGIDRHDQRRAGGSSRLHGGLGQPVTLLEPRGHVRDRVDAQPPQREREDRQPGDPVGVEVTEDEHRL